MIRGKASIDLRLESRWSFASNELITISGARLGLAFEKKLRLGIGLNWLKTPVKRSYLGQDEYGNAQNKWEYFKLAYGSIYADIVFYKTKRWQLSVPLQLGAGSTWLQDGAAYQFSDRKDKEFLLLYEPGITVHFKLTRWLGLGSDVAYRFCLKANKKAGEQLSSPTYSLKILFWPDQLFYLLFPESELTQRKGPATW